VVTKRDVVVAIGNVIKRDTVLYGGSERYPSKNLLRPEVGIVPAGSNG
jgi:hypothetical protein